MNKSEAPLITFGESANPATEFTYPFTEAIPRTFFSYPRCFSSTAICSSAHCFAAS